MGSRSSAFNHHILFRRPGALKQPIDRGGGGRTLRFAALGQIPYLLATVLAFVSPYVTMVICAGCAIYYAFPIASRAGDGGQSGASIA